VFPATLLVSLFATVRGKHETTVQVNTDDQSETPGATPKQVEVKELPPDEL